MRTLPLLLVILLVLLPAHACFSQTTPPVAPIPADSLELATGATQVASTPQAREVAINLIERARQNGDLHAPGSTPYTLKVSFNAAGNALQTGSGEMEETWFDPYLFRWTLRMGDYSLTRTSTHNGIYDDKPGDFVPMRVHMLRSVLFWAIAFQPGHTLIRTANATWKGQPVTCILTSGDRAEATDTPGRRWIEREFCIDNRTGLLQILSDAPGIYVVYDYANALTFHGRTLPGQITIVEGAHTVLEARVGGIVDAPTSSAGSIPSVPPPGAFSGPLLGGTVRFARFISAAPGVSIVQPVIVHAIFEQDGKVRDAEPVESSGPLAEVALDFVRRSIYPPEGRGHRQYEAFVNVQFVSK